jgi:F-type H+-transporting ATPase subunit g
MLADAALARNLATFQSYLQPLINTARHPMSAFTETTMNSSTMTPEHILSRIRNLSRQDMVSGAVVACEVLGFFTVGEMLGRFKLVGYSGDREHHETATPH